jgi:hypothetical protein
MATYEYRIVQVRIDYQRGRSTGTKFSATKMNQLAAEGWRVVAGGGAGGASQGHSEFEEQWVVMEREVE